MTYQMIVTDLDGTLLNSRSSLSQKTILTIERLKKENKIIVIASGRTYAEIVRLTKPLDLLSYNKAYFICYNGVLTVKTNPFTVLMKITLKKDDVKQIIDSLKDQDIKYHIFGENRLFLSNDIKYTLEDHQSKEVEVKKINVNEYDQEDDIYKLLIYDDKSKLDYVKKHIPLFISNNYSVVKSSDQLLEIFHKEGSKGHALIYLSKLLSIPQEEIIAFGDEENDISMIEFAGLGVAVSNAKQDVISAAKVTTLSNVFDGVAIAIDKYVK